jgi:integrase
MSRYSYPNIYTRKYKTRGGAARVMFYCQFKDWKGVRRTFPLGDQYEQAKKLRDQYLSQNREQYDFDQVETLVLRFPAWVEKWLSLTVEKRSHDKDIRSARRLAAFFGAVAPGEITSVRVEEYKRHRREQVSKYQRAFAPATINRELACLRSILIMIEESRELKDRSGERVPRPKIKLYPEPQQRKRTITMDEYRRLKAGVAAPYDLVLTIMWELGSRETETCFLRRSRVDLLNELLTFTETKTEPRTVPMGPRVAEVLGPYLSGLAEGEERLFPRATRFKLWGQFKRARKQTGILDVTLHDFRRTFRTRKADEGWNPKAVMLIMGSKDVRVFEGHYNQPQLPSLRAVVSGVMPDIVPRK